MVKQNKGGVLLKLKKYEYHISEWTIVYAFFSFYKFLTFIFCVSLCISIFYSCNMTFRWFATSSGVAIALNFINNLALALIANTIFCYFQVHRPEYLRKTKIRKIVQQSLFQIKHLMSFRIEHIYQQKYGERIAFQDMSIDKLGSLFNNMLSMESCAVKTFNENIQKCECFTNLEAISSSCVEIADLCTHILSSYASDLDEEILSILEHIYKSFFLVFFRTHAGELTSESSWSEYFLHMQKPYIEEYQKAYIQLIQRLNKPI